VYRRKNISTVGEGVRGLVDLLRRGHGKPRTASNFPSARSPSPEYPK
jgi:hypothetical protein